MISSCTEVWQGVCRELGWRIDESIQDASHWKGVYLKAKLRTMQLKDEEAFETSSLIGHSARVYALYYKDGLLCTGTAALLTLSLLGLECSSHCHSQAPPVCPGANENKWSAAVLHHDSTLMIRGNASPEIEVTGTHSSTFIFCSYSVY